MTHLLLTKSKHFCLAILIALGYTHYGYANNDLHKNIEKPIASKHSLQSILKSSLAKHEVPSAAIALIQGHKEAQVIVEGERAAKQSASPNTLYNIASLTKPISAQLAHQLVAAGQLSLDAQPGEHFIDPDIAGSEYLSSLTYAHLLSHQSGFPNWRYMTDNQLSFGFKPGSASQYSGEGYQYFAKAIENKTQKDYPALLKDFVFDAYGMNSATYHPQKEQFSELALPFGPEKEYGSASIQKTYNAADDLYITVNDYAKFVHHVLLEIDHKAPRWQIAHDMSNKLCASGRIQKAHCPKALGFTQGWTRIDYAEETIYMHGGADWGERSIVIMLPKSQSGIVIFTNGHEGMKVIHDILKALNFHPSLVAFIAMQAGI